MEPTGATCELQAVVVNLWSGPRSMSTALMYSFAQRSDTRVVDEPLYGHFLAHTGAARPDREATLAAWPTGAQSALAMMTPDGKSDPEGRVLFCKHMANHLEGLDWNSFVGQRHVLLFRNPAAVMASYGAHIERPVMRDLCYAEQVDILNRLDAEGTPPVVVCSDRLQEEPERVLTDLCLALGLPWEEEMLQWEAGPRPEDGPWAPWWYRGVHASTGWEARPAIAHAVPEHLADLHAECDHLYRILLERAL